MDDILTVEANNFVLRCKETKKKKKKNKLVKIFFFLVRSKKWFQLIRVVFPKESTKFRVVRQNKRMSLARRGGVSLLRILVSREQKTSPRSIKNNETEDSQKTSSKSTFMSRM